MWFVLVSPGGHRTQRESGAPKRMGNGKRHEKMKIRDVPQIPVAMVEKRLINTRPWGATIRLKNIEDSSSVRPNNLYVVNMNFRHRI